MKPTQPIIKLVLGILLIAVGAWIVLSATPDYSRITTYDECVQAGFPVLKTIPPQCQLPTKITFIQTVPAKFIADFESCAEAGYPVMESYPRQCRSPNGQTFVEKIATEPNPGSPPNIPASAPSQFSCTVDSDCQLAKKEMTETCCTNDQCAPVDYSQDDWIAVNSTWFTTQRQNVCNGEICKKLDYECEGQFVNTKFVAQCEQDMCIKRPVDPNPNLETAKEEGPGGWTYYKNIHDDATCRYLGGIYATTGESGDEYRCVILA